MPHVTSEIREGLALSTHCGGLVEGEINQRLGLQSLQRRMLLQVTLG